MLPNAEKYIQEKSLPREFWLEAGAQGMLGLAIPEEYGGAGADDFRFNAVLTEEMAKVGDEIQVRVDEIDDRGKVSLCPVGDDVEGSGDEPGGANGTTASFEDAFDAEMRETFGDLGPTSDGGGERGGDRGGRGDRGARDRGRRRHR